MSRRMIDDPKNKYLIRKARERRHMARTSQVLDQKADESNWAGIRMFCYIAFVCVLLLLMSGGHGLLKW
jgi:hypothetical protein